MCVFVDKQHQDWPATKFTEHGIIFIWQILCLSMIKYQTTNWLKHNAGQNSRQEIFQNQTDSYEQRIAQGPRDYGTKTSKITYEFIYTHENIPEGPQKRKNYGTIPSETLCHLPQAKASEDILQTEPCKSFCKIGVDKSLKQSLKTTACGLPEIDCLMSSIQSLFE